MIAAHQPTRPFGFNVIGHITSNVGLGVAARNLIDLIVERGHPVAAYDLKARFGRDDQVTTHAAHLRESMAALPYAINVFVFPIRGIHTFLPQLKSEFDYDSYFNASLCYWELSTIPPQWIPALESLDALVATSEYMGHVYRCSISRTSVVPALLPVRLPEHIPGPRLRRSMDIPPYAVVYVTTFEPASDPNRKNPLAVVDAFREGVGDEPDAYLVLRVNNAAVDGVEDPFVTTLRQRVAGHPRIRIYSAPLDYPGILGLYAESDVFVSLHRAEGLGLAMAEAMLLGKPVVATAWSGNLTFMDRLSACLVGYHLVPVRDASMYEPEQLEDTTVWADADIGEAATWMRRLHRDPELRGRIGRAARDRMRGYNDEASKGRFLLELQALLEQRATFPRMAADDDDAQAAMRRLRASRLAQYQELERELRWIKSRMGYRFAMGIKRAFKNRIVARLVGGTRH